MAILIPRTLLPLAAALALAACGGTAEPTLEQARLEYAQDNYAAARATLIALAADEPANPDNLRLLARAHLRLGDGDAAQAVIDRLAQTGAGDLALLKAEALTLRGLPDDALAALGNDASRDAQRIRAAALLRKGEPLAALDAFDAARAAGGSYELWLAWADFCTVANDLDAADAALAKAQAANPKGLRAALLAGRLLAARGRIDAAIAAYGKAAQNHPAAAAPLVAIAELHERQGKLDKAEAALKRADEISPGDATIDAIAVRIAAAQGKWAEVRKALQAIEREPGEVTPDTMLYAESMLRLGNVEQARVMLSAAVTVEPNNAYARMLLADARLQGGDAIGALDTLRPLLDEPAAEPAVLDLAIKAAEAADDPLADLVRNRAASSDYKQLVALSGDVQMALMASRWSDAAAAMEMLAARRGDAVLDKNRAYVLARMGRGAEALPLANRALAAQPDDPEAMKAAALARIAAATGLDEAKALLVRALAVSPLDYEAALALHRIGGPGTKAGTA